MKNKKIKYLFERLTRNIPILLDGATGTEIERHGFTCTLPLWSTHALIAKPSLVQKIHQEYIEAGSEIITANTFRTNKRVFRNAGIEDRSEELTCLAVSLAKEVIKNKAKDRLIWVAGSMAPLEDCYRPDLIPPVSDLKKEHSEHARNLVNAGADIIFIETMNSLIEARYALEAAMSFDIPVFVGFVSTGSGTLLSGESFDAAAKLCTEYKPAGVLINCTPAEFIDKPLDFLLQKKEFTIGVYANIGHADNEKGWESTNELDADAYARHARRWIEKGIKLIGGCCGTGPRHIRALKDIINSNLS